MKKAYHVVTALAVFLVVNAGCKKENIVGSAENPNGLQNPKKSLTATVSSDVVIKPLVSTGTPGKYSVSWNNATYYFTNLQYLTGTFTEGEFFEAVVSDHSGAYLTGAPTHILSLPQMVTSTSISNTWNEVREYLDEWEEYLQGTSTTFPWLDDYVPNIIWGGPSNTPVAKAVLIRTASSPNTFAIASANYLVKKRYQYPWLLDPVYTRDGIQYSFEGTGETRGTIIGALGYNPATQTSQRVYGVTGTYVVNNGITSVSNLKVYIDRDEYFTYTGSL